MNYSGDHILKTIIKGASIIFFGTFFTYIFNFIYRIILSRYLGPSDYGLISLGQMILNLAAIFALFGMHEAIIRYVAYYNGGKKYSKVKGSFYSALKISLPISLIISGVIIVFSEFIAYNIFNSPDFKWILIIFSLAIPVFVFLKIISFFFLGLKKTGYKELSLNILTNFFNLTLVFIVIIIGGNVFHISLVYLFSLLLSSFFAFLLYKFFISPKIFSKNLKPIYNYKQLITFSLPLLFTGIFFKIMGWADTFFLGIFKSSYEVGIYNVAFPLAAFMGMFLIAFGQIYYPLSTELIAKKQIQGISKMFQVIIRWTFMMSFPIFLIIVLFPKFILNFLFGKEYITGYIALIILVSAYFLNIITGPGMYTLKSFKKIKFIFYLNLMIVLLNIALNIILAPKYGIEGVAVATAVSIILKELTVFFKVKSIIKFSYNFKYYLKYLISGLLSLGLTYIILVYFFSNYNFFQLIILLIMFFSLYLIFLFLFKSFNDDDIMVMKAIEKKLGINLKFFRKILKKNI